MVQENIVHCISNFLLILLKVKSVIRLPAMTSFALLFTGSQKQICWNPANCVVIVIVCDIIYLIAMYCLLGLNVTKIITYELDAWIVMIIVLVSAEDYS